MTRTLSLSLVRGSDALALAAKRNRLESPAEKSRYALVSRPRFLRHLEYLPSIRLFPQSIDRRLHPFHVLQNLFHPGKPALVVPAERCGFKWSSRVSSPLQPSSPMG